MSDTLSIELPISPESAGWARKAVGEFRDRLDESSFVDLQLMVSELVSDAVHAEAGEEHEIAIRIEARHRRIHVEVQEGAIAYRLRSRRPEPGDAGWGVYLTRVLADRWGTSHQGDRGCVWLEMPLAATSQV
jgi:anti-sigma regulatory factor (Ser/Thr protein kinase)